MLRSPAAPRCDRRWRQGGGRLRILVQPSGIEIHTGASGAVRHTRGTCTTGIRASGAATSTGSPCTRWHVGVCHGLTTPLASTRTVEMSDLQLTQNLKADLGRAAPSSPRD
jgi:hypothetical protein